MLTVSHMKKTFGTRNVLDGIDFTVKKGDVTVILGPSGSGKTTLLRCINFLEEPDEGLLDFDELHLNCKDVSGKQILEVRRKTGFVFQNYNLFANKTALQNVEEGLLISRKFSKAKARESALQALQKVGLTEYADYYPNALSGGQCQRVGIARAIALSPEIIFFDEPTSALDPELVSGILSCMKQLAAEGTTMVVVTHEMNFASEVANHVIFMEGGHIVEEGPPQQIFRHPQKDRTRQFLRLISADFDYTI